LQKIGFILERNGGCVFFLIKFLKLINYFKMRMIWTIFDVFLISNGIYAVENPMKKRFHVIYFNGINAIANYFRKHQSIRRKQNS